VLISDLVAVLPDLLKLTCQNPAGCVCGCQGCQQSTVGWIGPLDCWCKSHDVFAHLMRHTHKRWHSNSSRHLPYSLISDGREGCNGCALQPLNPSSLSMRLRRPIVNESNLCLDKVMVIIGVSFMDDPKSKPPRPVGQGGFVLYCGGLLSRTLASLIKSRFSLIIDLSSACCVSSRAWSIPRSSAVASSCCNRAR